MRKRMHRLVGRPRGRVAVCERCGTACDQRCRADAALEQARTRAVAARVGL
jgi:hypothetical protein